MIEKLTKEQEARFPEFIKKWTDIGLCTDPANRKEADNGIRLAYKSANLSAPKIVWCGSPLSQGITRAIVIDKKAIRGIGDSVRASVRASVWDSVWASVWASVGDSVWASVGDSVRDSVWDSVRASVWDSVWASVWASVGDSVGDSVRDSVWASVRDSVWASVWDSVWASIYGQHEAGWIGFYDFFRTACGLIKETDALIGLQTICENAGWFLSHVNICWISERHNILKRNERGRLHCDGGPAVQYPDGWSIYALNGVLVNESHAVTPAEQIAPETVLAETNADIRRELIRKVGVERMLAKLPHKVIDKLGDYELLSLKLSSQVTDARYLKMLNPSVGVWHAEGVPPEINTVESALNWREEQWFEKERPQVLT